MKGTEKIIAHIKADAQTKADAILAQAEQQCAAIREEYKAKAKESYGERIRSGVKACEDFVESKGRIAEMESKKELLALKQEMVNASFDRAREKVLALPEEDYLQFLVKLVGDSVSTGDEQIVLNARDKEKFGAELVKAANGIVKDGKLSLSDETGDFAGGLVLRRGAIEINNTLDLLISRCRSEMSAQLAKVLFG